MTPIPTTPEALRAEQERRQKLLEAYEKADAAFEAADTEYWLNQRHLPHPMRITTLKSELNAARKRLELAAPDLIQSHAALLGAYAEALERERWIPVEERLPEDFAPIAFCRCAGTGQVECCAECGRICLGGTLCRTCKENV